MYVLAHNQIVEKFPYSIGDLRKDNPQTSFPRNPAPETLAEWNVYPVVSTGTAYDSATQVAVQEGCEYVNNRWQTAWTVRAKTPDELATDAANAASSVRNERDRLLSETDWVIIQTQEQRYRGQSNVVPSQSFLDYRQALRDITNQVGFPFTIEWPVKP